MPRGLLWGTGNFQNSLQPSLTNHFTPLPGDTWKAAFKISLGKMKLGR